MPNYKYYVCWNGDFSRRCRAYCKTNDGWRLDIPLTLEKAGMTILDPEYQSIYDLLVQERDDPQNIAHLAEWAVQATARMNRDVESIRRRQAVRAAERETFEETRVSPAEYLRRLRDL